MKYTGSTYFDNPNLVDIELDLDDDLVEEICQLADEENISFDEYVAKIIQIMLEEQKEHE